MRACDPKNDRNPCLGHFTVETGKTAYTFATQCSMYGRLRPPICWELYICKDNIACSECDKHKMSKTNSQFFTGLFKKSRITWPSNYFRTIGLKMTDRQTDRMTSSVDDNIDWHDCFYWSPKKIIWQKYSVNFPYARHHRPLSI